MLESEKQNASVKAPGSGRQYAVAGIATLVLAFGIYIVAKPYEPPRTPAAEPVSTDLPENHPNVDSPGMRTPGVEQLAEQVKLFRAESEQRPDDPATRLGLANSLYDLAQATEDPETFAEASDVYRSYLARSPEDPNARTDYAYTLYRTGHVDRAIVELKRVRKNHPDHQHSAFNLGIMYKEKDMPDSVLAFMRITAEIDPDSRPGKAASEVLRAYSESH